LHFDLEGSFEFVHLELLCQMIGEFFSFGYSPLSVLAEEFATSLTRL
jgi:hypothetical protein